MACSLKGNSKVLLMSNMIQTASLQRAVYFLLLSFLIIAALYYAKPFLVPVCFAGLLSMLFLPLSRWFQNKKIPAALSIVLCIVIFLVVFTGIIWLISWQITDLSAEAGNIEGKLKRMISQVENVNDKHHQLNVSSLPVGLYYVKVNHKHGVVSQLLSVIK